MISRKWLIFEQKSGALLDSVIKYTTKKIGITLGQNYLTSSEQKWSKFGSKWANLRHWYFWKTSQKATLPPPPTQSIVFFFCCLMMPKDMLQIALLFIISCMVEEVDGVEVPLATRPTWMVNNVRNKTPKLCPGKQCPANWNAKTASFWQNFMIT